MIFARVRIVWYIIFLLYFICVFLANILIKRTVRYIHIYIFARTMNLIDIYCYTYGVLMIKPLGPNLFNPKINNSRADVLIKPIFNINGHDWLDPKECLDRDKNRHQRRRFLGHRPGGFSHSFLHGPNYGFIRI